MEMKQEMMSDAIDDGMDNAEDVENADKIYAQICEEIGIEVAEDNEVGKNQVSSGAVSSIKINC